MSVSLSLMEDLTDMGPVVLQSPAADDRIELVYYLPRSDGGLTMRASSNLLLEIARCTGDFHSQVNARCRAHQFTNTTFVQLLHLFLKPKTV